MKSRMRKRQRITHVEAKPAGNYLADDLSNSVQITLAKGVMAPGSEKAMCLAAQTSIPISDDETSLVSNLGLKLADGTKVAFSLSFFNGEAAQNVTPARGAEPPTHFCATGSASAVAVAPRASRAGTWLLASALISLTTLYTICNPNWVPSFFDQPVKISKQLSADITRRTSTPLGGTAVTDTAKAGAGTVAGAASIHGLATAPASLRDVDRSIAQHHDSSSGAHRTIAADRDETGTRDFMNQGSTQGVAFPATEMPKVAEARTSKLKKGFMVPPPPPTPCVLPPAFDFFLQQPAAPQQQSASSRTEAKQSAALVVADEELQATDQELQAADQELQAADQELQAALRSSLRTVSEWTR